MTQKFCTVFWYGSTRTICSTHRTMKAAIKAALACEKRGGAKHTIWIVREQSIEEHRRMRKP